MFERLKAARGVIRSLRIYYGDRTRRAALDRLYGRFVAPGDLVFDVGAHVGDRVAAFRRLGARVIAVEPQPPLARTLRLLYGRDTAVTVVEAAVGSAEGSVELKLNLQNPTVSTVSATFIEAAQGAPGWEGQRWERSITVSATTLDALIARHGTPRFIKIDVEGLEYEVLCGLFRPVQALSFEFTTIQREVALACVERCAALGYERFNACLGESATFVHGRCVSRAEIVQWLESLPHDSNSGDVYAQLA
jgi:FkbM family methyltransferase